MRRMKWNFAAAILPLLLFQQLFSFAPAVPVRGQDSAPVPDTNVLDTTVCELTTHLDRLEGKMVRVKVQMVTPSKGPEAKDVDNQCTYFLRLAYRSAASTSSSPPAPSASTRDIPRPILIRDDQFDLLNKYLIARMYPRTEGARCKLCNRYDQITATMTGMVNFPERTLRGSDGPPPYLRMFFVQSVADVKARDISATYDPKEYSTEPVIYPRAYVTGKLLGPDGKPLPQTNVQISSNAPPSPSKHGDQQKTDDQGQFGFAVRPGDYVLTINLYTGPSADLPYDTTYFPGTTEEASAKVIQLKAEQHVDHVTFRLPGAKRLRERKFSGKIEWADGRPASDAFVHLTDVELHNGVVFRGPSTRSDADGNFTVNGFDGKDYFVHAGADLDHKPATSTGHKPVCAEKVRVNSTAPSDVINLKLTVSGQIPCIQQ